MSNDGLVYDLVINAVESVFGNLNNYQYRVDELMGTGFWAKNWVKTSDHELDTTGRRFVSTAEFELLKLYAGPYGRILWRTKQAKELTL